MILIIIVVLLAFYLYGTRTFRYWKVRNIKHEKPLFLVGTNLKNYLCQKNITQQAENVYWKFPKEKVVGFYRGWRPELVIRDPEIVKRILTKDFYYFHKRGLSQHEKVEPLLQNLFFLEGDLWRLVRQRFTAAFTTSKLKSMFPLLLESVDRIRDRISSTVKNDVSVIDSQDLMTRFTIDFICASGFGIDAGALKDDDAHLRKLGLKIFVNDYRDIAVLTLKDIIPEITNKLMTFSSAIEDDFFSLTRNVLKTRIQQSSKRKDFIDLLIDCNTKGPMAGTSIDKFNSDGMPEIVKGVMDEKLMAAQVFVFFAAGFLTSASTTSFILHQLAHYPLVKEKLHEEIDRILLKYNNTLTYEAVKEMPYLLSTFNEALRMFPPVAFISRKCTRKYTFHDLDLTIDKGVAIIIPVKAIHNDPLYYENPEEFRPERFLFQENNTNNKLTFLPFGEGPRSCVGNRLGMMQSLSGLVAVLSDFTVEPASITVRYPEVNPMSNLVQVFKEGLPLTFRKRRK